MRLLTQQIFYLIAGKSFDWFKTFAEDTRAGRAFQDDGAVFVARHRAFTQREDGRVVLFQKLSDAFLACLAHVF